MRLREWMVAVAGATAFCAVAQLAVTDPDWKELDIPGPPTFDVLRLLSFDVSSTSGLIFGIDPATLSIGRDGIVRYVLVARSTSGAVNTLYEGLRCATGEVRTYARHSSDKGWDKASDSDWKPLRAGQRSLHALMLARQGACVGNAAPQSVEHIVQALKNQGLDKAR